MKKVAVILSGAGVFDGAEIHESVITLLALDRQDANVRIFAPNVPQMHVVNHLSQQPMDETRNVLVESARIARGVIKDLAEANINDFDAIIFPGGYGVAKNLSNFAVKGADCSVNPEVEQFVIDGLKAGKVMGFICIAPALCARIAVNAGVYPTITIGSDQATAAAIESVGARHVNCLVNDIVVDEQNKIVTTPAYMLGQRIREVAEGIEKLVDKVLKMC
jgi:enhancing lycopene biosynthesis protein 2